MECSSPYQGLGGLEKLVVFFPAIHVVLSILWRIIAATTLPFSVWPPLLPLWQSCKRSLLVNFIFIGKNHASTTKTRFPLGSFDFILRWVQT